MPLVQFLALSILAIVVFCALFDFKKTIIIWTPLSFLFNTQVCVLYGSSSVPLTVGAQFMFIFIYFLRKPILCTQNDRFYMNIYFSIMLFSVFLSSIFSVIPFLESIKVLTKSYILSFAYVFFFFKCMNSKEDVILMGQICIVVAVLITIDGIVEFFTHVNFAGDFIYKYSPQDDNYGRSFYVPYYVNNFFNQRFGLTRSYSFFGIHISFGVACLFLLQFLSILNLNSERLFKTKNRWLSNNLLLITIYLLLVGIICSNSKTPLLGLLIFLPCLFRIDQIVNLRTIALLIITCFFLYEYAPNYFNNFFSLFDEELAEEGGGSTLQLREIQYGIIKKLFYNSPIVGNGINSAMYFSKNVAGYEDIMGAESVWFKILPDQGIIGGIAYVCKYVSYYLIGKNIIPTKILLGMLLSLFVMETSTGNLSFVFFSSLIFTLKIYYKNIK